MELQSIARSGGSIRVSAGKKTAMELQSIARSLGPDGKLFIMNAGEKSTMELQSIARSAPGKVFFDFT